MEDAYASLASTITILASSHPKKRYLVAVAGAPGSGKTTLATAVASQINRSRQLCQEHTQDTANGLHTKQHKALVLSMDGFHLPRLTLDALPDEKRNEAYIRRGAPWTFDIGAFVAFMQKLRGWADLDAVSEDVLYAPTFSHAMKDPVPDSLTITPDTNIVIVEGNYLLLDEPEWRDIAGIVDYRVFVDVDLDEARERLARRHVEAGIEQTLEKGFARVDANDGINGRSVNEKLVKGVDAVVRSVRETRDLRV